MPVIATAGHVDHGKSALIEALTGRNPDRLEEEKRRGLTIDLGFAWTTLASGVEVGFVDVPGHHRFIANMLAGVGPVSSAILVVAADEGWKPQTEEHLAVLDLLGAARVVVALTKSDLVNDVTGRVEEVRMQLLGTVAQTAAIVPVSVRTGAGLDVLRRALAELAVAPPDRARPNLWVDRVFSIRGAGTVITGTLLDGSLSVGSEVALSPDGETVRVRALQSHEQQVTHLPAGSRAALNLAGLQTRAVARGVRIALPNSFRAASRLLVSFRLARYVDEFPARGAFQLHLGTASVAASLDVLAPGYAQVRLAAPLWVEAGDRFVVRDAGRRLVLAGGSVLDPDARARRAELIAQGPLLVEALDQGRDALAHALLTARGRATRSDLAAWSGGGRVDGIGGEVLLAPAEVDGLVRKAVELVADHQRTHPLDSGIGFGLLASQLGLDEGTTRAIVEQAAELVAVGSEVTIAGSKPDVVDEVWRELSARLSTAAPPTLAELALDRDVLRRLLRERRLVRVAENLVYLPAIIDEVVGKARSIGGPFTVSEFRQCLGISRKHAVPLLEYFDREGVTVRSGDTRTVR